MIPWNSKKPIAIDDIAKKVIQNFFNFNFSSIIINLIFFEFTVIMVKCFIFLFFILTNFKCDNNNLDKSSN